MKHGHSIALLLSVVSTVQGSCPYMADRKNQDEVASDYQMNRSLKKISDGTGGGKVPAGGFKAVQADLEALMTISNPEWPADFAPPTGPHYGGLFIRLAWHCAGSYREHDGRGGCDGGRIRYDPELNWPDNANLDKALNLLKPIKSKYGNDLSWGDLIILSGNAAIESMGGPTIGFCGGRIDDADGADSLKLGPSREQEEIGPCQTLGLQGKCLSVNGTALGPTTVGLIYVNPAGPVGFEGNPIVSGRDIRTAFARMGFNDEEAVVLIGGGHAFGKMHGACPKPPCGDGKGLNTFTSGFEGSWTTIPTTWSNEYFKNLFEYTWETVTGPGGNLQWSPFEKDGTKGPAITMLTTDIALARDRKYKPLATRYSNNLSKLEEDFAKAWYRLTTGDMGPSVRCIGDLLPKPQDFQSPLPAPPTTLPDFIPIRAKIRELIVADRSKKADFINLAYQCASTFRATDYRGGCNGARIRFSPEKDWPENVGTQKALDSLAGVKRQYPGISYSDLIVLAGQTALEHRSKLNLKFCGGRVDADNAKNSASLKKRYYEPAVVMVRDDFQVKGLTPEEGVALAARQKVTDGFFESLLRGGAKSSEERALLEGEFLPIVQKFAKDETALLAAFESAWTKMMTADRFDKNYGNVCDGVSTPTLK